jgi:hypothetical protein
LPELQRRLPEVLPEPTVEVTARQSQPGWYFCYRLVGLVEDANYLREPLEVDTRPREREVIVLVRA